MEVSLAQGKLKGKIDYDHWKSRYLCFQGIPYAKPPIGNLRFKDPEPLSKWDGTLDCTKERSGCFCLDMMMRQFQGSEDCLFVNVYTKKLPIDKTSKELKPVMVWIHGGGFNMGSSESAIYGPGFLMSQDIVFVSFNYRLAVLGFTSFEDESLGVNGNAGLKDMVLALKWIKKNIAHFNGDPDNVTIFGESAGGAAVNLLMLSPLSEGLFNKAIMLSGCALNPWVEGVVCGKLVSKALDFNGDTDKDCLEFLQKLSLDQLGQVMIKIKDHFDVDRQRFYGPIVEKQKDGTAFLPEHPKTLLKEGKFHKVPVMMGYTSREGMLHDMIKKEEFPKIEFDNEIPYLFNVAKGSEVAKNIAKMIRDFYFGGQEPTADNKDRYYLLKTDNDFLREIYTVLHYLLDSSTEPVYFYRFSIDAQLNFFKNILQITRPGMSHGDDLGYIFKMNITPDFHANSIEDLTVRRTVKLLANFAKYGNPTPDKEDDLINLKWLPAKPERINYLEIGENLSVGVNPDYHRMLFWKNVQKLITGDSKL